MLEEPDAHKFAEPVYCGLIRTKASGQDEFFIPVADVEVRKIAQAQLQAQMQIQVRVHVHVLIYASLQSWCATDKKLKKASLQQKIQGYLQVSLFFSLSLVIFFFFFVHLVLRITQSQHVFFPGSRLLYMKGREIENDLLTFERQDPEVIRPLPMPVPVPVPELEPTAPIPVSMVTSTCIGIRIPASTVAECVQRTTRFAFAVVYSAPNDKTAVDMFSHGTHANSHLPLALPPAFPSDPGAETGSPEFEEFLAILGEKVRLKGFDKFRGGLDVVGAYQCV